MTAKQATSKREGRLVQGEQQSRAPQPVVFTEFELALESCGIFIGAVARQLSCQPAEFYPGGFYTSHSTKDGELVIEPVIDHSLPFNAMAVRPDLIDSGGSIDSESVFVNLDSLSLYSMGDHRLDRLILLAEVIVREVSRFQAKPHDPETGYILTNKLMPMHYQFTDRNSGSLTTYCDTVHYTAEACKPETNLECAPLKSLSGPNASPPGSSQRVSTFGMLQCLQMRFREIGYGVMKALPAGFQAPALARLVVGQGNPARWKECALADFATVHGEMLELGTRLQNTPCLLSDLEQELLNAMSDEPLTGPELATRIGRDCMSGQVGEALARLVKLGYAENLRRKKNQKGGYVRTLLGSQSLESCQNPDFNRA